MEEAKKERLYDSEKSLIKNNLLSVIRESSLGEGIHKRNPKWFAFLNFNNLILKPIPIVLALLALTTGIAFAANDSLPGDTLYPVKVNLNEKVGSWLAVSEEAKADWDVRLAEKRLEEIGELIVRDKFSPEASEEVQSNFLDHTDKAQRRIDRIKSSEPENDKAIRIEAKLQETLDSYTEIIINIDDSSKEDDEDRVKARSIINQDSDPSIKARTKERFEDTEKSLLKVKDEVELDTSIEIINTLNELDIDLREDIEIDLGL